MTITVLLLTLSLIFCQFSQVVKAQPQQITTSYGYETIAQNGINILDAEHMTEKDRWDLSNFTFFGDGIYHGSDIPESKVEMKLFKNSYTSGTLKLVQNVTFQPTLIMSGTFKFWLRLPVKLCNVTCDADTFDDIYNRTSSKTRLWINNTETNQSFVYSGFDIYNRVVTYPDGSRIGGSTNYDINHGRGILQLNLPIYSGVKYQLTFRGEIKNGFKPVFYLDYGDLGDDNVMGSRIKYTYFDTGSGNPYMFNKSIPFDLGYSFIFIEGLPSTGVVGAPMNTPQDSFAIIDYDTNFDDNDTSEMFYHFILPISPFEPGDNLTFDLLIIALGTDMVDSAKTLRDVTWNTTYLSFSVNFTQYNGTLDFRILLKPTDSFSQEYIITMRDRFVYTDDYIYDGNDKYWFSPDFFIFKTNYNLTGWRNSRACGWLCGEDGNPITDAISSVSNFVESKPDPIDEGYKASNNVLRFVGDSIIDAGYEEEVNQFVSRSIDEEFDISEGDLNVDTIFMDSGNGIVIPSLHPETPSSETTQQYNTKKKDNFLDSFLGMQTNGAGLPGFEGGNQDDVDAGGDDDHSDDTCDNPGPFNICIELDIMGALDDLTGSIFDNLGFLEDGISDIISEIETFGANFIDSVTSFLTPIIDTMEMIISFLLFFIGLMAFVVTIGAFAFVNKIILLIATGKLDEAIETVMRPIMGAVKLGSKLKGGGVG
jgi:hypothetical protein